MTIPKYYELMLPILKFASDKNEHSLKETRDSMAKEFKLTEEELSEMLPSGTQTVFYNRVGWAKGYLVQAGLLSSPKRGYLKITETGSNVLKDAPDIIDTHYLEQFEAFKDFKNRTRKAETVSEETSATEEESTPEERLEDAYEQINSELAQRILDEVKSCSPQFFERLVVALLVKMGYGGSQSDAGKSIGRSGDEGIDGIIKEDKLGLDVIYIQAKRWENNVPRPELDKFVGALAGKGAQKGVFLTTANFSEGAIEYAQRLPSPKVVLINGTKLAELMIEYDLGVTTRNTFRLKEVDSDYFIEE